MFKNTICLHNFLNTFYCYNHQYIQPHYTQITHYNMHICIYAYIHICIANSQFIAKFSKSVYKTHTTRIYSKTRLVSCLLLPLV